MSKRIFFLYFLLLISFIVLVVRLFCLQIIKGEDFLTISQENRIRIEKIPPARGIIFDREEKPLVRNIPVYKRDTRYEIRDTIIPKEEALKLELAGKEVEMGLAREYMDGEIFASVLGYVDVELVGRMGAEAVYDQVLTGQEGGRLVEVDSEGEILHEMGQQEPVSGQNLYLAIDSRLQKKAWEVMKGNKGAIVVSQPKNGQILALVSSPSYDPNLFSQQEGSTSLPADATHQTLQAGEVKSANTDSAEPFGSELGAELLTAEASEVKMIQDLLESPDQPLFNRALAGLYPPGSVFKIVTAAAGLEEGKIDAQTLIEDTGEIRIGAYRYGNWYYSQYGGKEGELNIVGALRRSNDIFFYKTGEYVGAKSLVEWAKKFGYGRLTEIDLLGEAEGFILDPYEKEKQTGERWFLGNTYHLAIGQGDLTVTPLQVNLMTNVIANGGKLCRPSVVDREKNSGGESRDSVDICVDLALKQETIELITEGMKQACEPGGTGVPFFDYPLRVACKTGTAEFGDPDENTHAWFTMFVLPNQKIKIDDEEKEIEPISVTVLVEKGGEGSKVAAPIAREIVEAYLGE